MSGAPIPTNGAGLLIALRQSVASAGLVQTAAAEAAAQHYQPAPVEAKKK